MEEKKNVCPYCDIEMVLVVEEENKDENNDNSKSKYRCPVCGYESIL